MHNHVTFVLLFYFLITICIILSFILSFTQCLFSVCLSHKHPSDIIHTHTHRLTPPDTSLTHVEQSSKTDWCSTCSRAPRYSTCCTDVYVAGVSEQLKYWLSEKKKGESSRIIILEQQTKEKSRCEGVFGCAAVPDTFVSFAMKASV